MADYSKCQDCGKEFREDSAHSQKGCSSFFKTEDFKATHELKVGYEAKLKYPAASPVWMAQTLINDLITTQEAAKQANLKIISNFEPNNYKPHEKEIELYVLVDKFGHIGYTGHNEQSVIDYKESNCLKDKFIVKLTGEMPGEEK
jgi:hypothetical protein